MTIFCNHCGKPICDKTERFRAILPTGSYDWRYYHDVCFIEATPPEHRTRGGYSLDFVDGSSVYP